MTTFRCPKCQRPFSTWLKGPAESGGWCQFCWDELIEKVEIIIASDDDEEGGDQ